MLRRSIISQVIRSLPRSGGSSNFHRSYSSSLVAAATYTPLEDNNESYDKKVNGGYDDQEKCQSVHIASKMSRQLHHCPHQKVQHRHHQQQQRNFGLYRRRHEWPNEPTSEDLLREQFDSPPPDISEMKTAEEMDFYDPLTENYDNSESSGVDGSGTNDDQDGDDIGGDAEEEEEEEEMEAARQKAIRDEIDSRTGRLWTDPWEITDEDWSQLRTLDDLPDWSPEICSRVSMERVCLHPDGLPTIDKLATLPLPPSPPLHPAMGDPYPYIKYKKRNHYKIIYTAVSEIAKPHMERILSLPEWNDKQDSIDDLFELVQEELTKESKVDSKDDFLHVLRSQHDFPELVERALEDYLRSVVREEKEKWNAKQQQPKEKDGEEVGNDDENNKNDTQGIDEIGNASDDEGMRTQSDEESVPVFMDLLKAKGCILDKNGVPNLVHPLKPHPKDGPGRMIEEWELAANQDTKRIMARQCIRDIAQAVLKGQGSDDDGDASGGGASRIYVQGERGVGKTAALAAIVASARLSGHIVLYIPDGDRLRKNGFYHEPNSHCGDGDLFDLPILTQEVCEQLLYNHGNDLEGMVATEDCIQKFMNKDQLKKLAKFKGEDGGNMSLSTLLKLGSETKSLAAGCYGAVVHTLMNQSCKPFTVVMDEYNCYFDHGHYFHYKYDPKVQKSIPLNKFTLFQPLLDAMGVEKKDDGTFITKDPVLMKRGAIVVGTTESHAVARKFTTALTQSMIQSDVHIVNVPQFSKLEVDHALANFEVTGIGRLRFDRGATVMDQQEVAFLRMVSGGVGQKLLDACIV